MRILHLLDHSVPLHSAYSHAALSLLRQQRALGWHTIQLTSAHQGPVETQDRNDDDWHYFRTPPPVHPLARLPALGEASALWALARRLRHVARLTRPDILHAHAPPANALAALWVGRRLGLPVLVDQDKPMQGALGQLLLRHVALRAHAVAVASTAMRMALLATGVTPHKLHVVPPALSLRHFPAAARDARLARALGLDSGPVVVYIGPLDEDAGVDLLLAAIPPLLRATPALRLLVVGGGPQATPLRARAAALGIDAVFTGPVPRAELALHQGLADLLVLPRLPRARESASVLSAPLEAMARGALLVASNTDAHRDLIEHGTNGILFQAGELGSLVESLQMLLAEPSCWPRLRAGARAFVERERSFAASARRYAPIYTALLEGRAPR